MKVLLSRWQFGVTITYHFLFVPLTIGLALLVAVMQVLAYRKRDPVWERLTFSDDLAAAAANPAAAQSQAGTAQRGAAQQGGDAWHAWGGAAEEAVSSDAQAAHPGQHQRPGGPPRPRRRLGGAAVAA